PWLTDVIRCSGQRSRPVIDQSPFVCLLPTSRTGSQEPWPMTDCCPISCPLSSGIYPSLLYLWVIALFYVCWCATCLTHHPNLRAMAPHAINSRPDCKKAPKTPVNTRTNRILSYFGMICVCIWYMYTDLYTHPCVP